MAIHLDIRNLSHKARPQDNILSTILPKFRGLNKGSTDIIEPFMMELTRNLLSIERIDAILIMNLPAV